MITETVYMPLIGEGTEAWAPVRAVRCSSDTFLVVGPVPEGQLWKFGPDRVVATEHKVFTGGAEGLVATRLVGLPAIIADGWRNVEAEIAKIFAESVELFDEDTGANVRDLIDLMRDRYPVPESVDEGYCNTIRLTWGNFEIEVCEDRFELYRFFDQRTDIWRDAHRAGEPFSSKVLAELATI